MRTRVVSGSAVILITGSSPYERHYPLPTNRAMFEVEHESPLCLEVCLCIYVVLIVQFLFLGIPTLNYLKLASLNVNALSNPVKRSMVLAKLKKDKIQVSFLQETHMLKKEHNKFKQFGYLNSFFSSCKNRREGWLF